MGSLTIKIPMKIDRSFQVDDEKVAKQLLSELERMNRGPFDEVLGIWKGRAEQEGELTKKLRRISNLRNG
jgi:hypothetical protein